MFTQNDLQLLGKEAESFLNSFKEQDTNQEEYKTDSERTEDDIGKAESVSDFKLTVGEVFKNFPDIPVESPLEILKTSDFFGSQRDRMSMVYYYLLKVIEFFSLNGDVLKSNLTNDRDTILLALNLEEKLITSFKSSLLELIIVLLEDKKGLIDNFVSNNNLSLSASSTLIVVSENIKDLLVLRTFIISDYITSLNSNEIEKLNNLVSLFGNILEGNDNTLLSKIYEIFSENIVRNPVDIIKFISIVLSKDSTRAELATNLYSYGKSLAQTKNKEVK